MIEWLMQTTTDGCMYLQVIILVILAIGLSAIGMKTWNDIIELLKEGDEDDKTE